MRFATSHRSFLESNWSFRGSLLGALNIGEAIFIYHLLRVLFFFENFKASPMDPNRKFGKWVRFWIFIFGLPHYHEPNSKIPRGQLPFSAGTLCCLHHCNVVHRHTKGGDRNRSVSARPECILWQAHFGSLVCIPDQQVE